MAIQAALDDLGRIFKILPQHFLRNIKHFDLDVLPKVGAVDEKLETAPRRLNALDDIVMHDRIELLADPCVKLPYEEIQQTLVQPVDWLRGAMERLQQHTNSLRHALVGRRIGQRIGALETFHWTRQGHRRQIDLLTQRLVHALRWHIEHDGVCQGFVGMVFVVTHNKRLSLSGFRLGIARYR